MTSTIKAPATFTQIAAAYGVSTKTLRNWLRLTGIYKPHRKYRQLYTAAEIHQIIVTIGPPDLEDLKSLDQLSLI